MTIKLFEHFRATVTEPLRQIPDRTEISTTPLKRRVYDIGTAAFSIIGNWPFYGVAATFGNKYSSAFGKFLGATEFLTYSAFRFQNFQDVANRFWPLSPISNGGETETIDSGIPKNPAQCSWKETSTKVGAVGLGLLAQIPFMVLVYHDNGKQWAYPVITGLCEGAFTILSLLVSAQAISQRSNSPSIENARNLLIEKCDRFLSQGHNSLIIERQLEEISSPDSIQTTDELTQELLDSIMQWEEDIQPIQDSAMLTVGSRSFGALIATYVTVANGAVTYQGMKDLYPANDALAIVTTILVSLTNIYLLGKLCINSTANYCRSIRDICAKTYKPPLSYTIAPKSWIVGRAVSATLAAFSFGTTAIATRDYIPKIGNELISLAPISSLLLLRECLDQLTDQTVLWLGSKNHPQTRSLIHLHNSLLSFKEHLFRASPQEIQAFISQLSPKGSLQLMQSSKSQEISLLDI